MKKILSAILALTLLLFALTSCFGANDPEGNATLVIATEEIQVYDLPLSKLSAGKGLLPAFEYLANKEGLEYDVSGTLINNVGGLENNYETNTFVYIYTSVEADFDVSEYKSEVEYEGKTLVSSGKGFSEMTLCDGAVIYIGTIVFQ